MIRRPIRSAISAAVGVVLAATIGSGPAPDPTAPTLTDLLPYKVATEANTSATYQVVPWTGIGQPVAFTWPEAARGGMTLSPFMDVCLPLGTKPAAGWRWVLRLHSTGTPYEVGGGGYIGNWVKQVALTLNVAFITAEFRHPVSNADQGFPHDDVGRVIQMIRSCVAALGLDPNGGMIVCESRGNLGMLSQLRPDLQNLSATTHWGRQSSRGIKYIGSMSGQATYKPAQWAGWWCSNAAGSGPSTGPYAGLTAYDAYMANAASEAPGGVLPADGVLDSFVDRLDAVSGQNSALVPNIIMVHKETYWALPITVTAWPELITDKHLSNNGQKVRERMIAGGYGARVLTICGETEDNAGGREDQFADFVPTFLAMMDNPGVTLKHAWAITRTRRRAGGGTATGAGVYYLPAGAAPTGAFTAADGATPSTTAGSVVGALVDGSFGLDNRTKTPTSTPVLQGFAIGQTGASNKPTLSAFANGNLGVLFDSTDRLIGAYANSSLTQEAWAWCNTGGTAFLATTPANNNAGNCFLGQASGVPTGDLTNKVMSLAIISAQPGVWTPRDLQGMAQFARELDGVSAFLNP